MCPGVADGTGNGCYGNQKADSIFLEGLLILPPEMGDAILEMFVPFYPYYRRGIPFCSSNCGDRRLLKLMAIRFGLHERTPTGGRVNDHSGRRLRSGEYRVGG